MLCARSQSGSPGVSASRRSCIRNPLCYTARRRLKRIQRRRQQCDDCCSNSEETAKWQLERPCIFTANCNPCDSDDAAQNRSPQQAEQRRSEPEKSAQTSHHFDVSEAQTFSFS